ncbi:hypothetical protein KUTeg_007184 [Tegillarca granosa]|uniref:Uncharacterized protein n=1 Tax=Tegillarca granosa TaxID=220873 RepID=A0ABQ9FCI9_TEGGR|nr:hypothetical protein KUTeg_007184 [Tegillarca granosa]
MSVIGRVGECSPPYLVMPITIESSKPRMCHDARFFLNLCVKDYPFTLDTLKEVPRLIERNTFMSSLDDKSGYDHILLHKNSRTFFGLEFAGWFMVFNTISFGFKASANIYHMTGLVPISYCRALGVPCLLYIDDQLIVYLTRMGYKQHIECLFTPTRPFLGMICDSKRLCFVLPDDKKQTFITLREDILKSKEVHLKTLQRFAGKSNSLMLAVPAAKLYSKEVKRAISMASKNSKPIPLYYNLKEELLYWGFLDNWSDNKILIPIHNLVTFGAKAIVNALSAAKGPVKNSRIDIYCDNMAVVGAWNNHGASDPALNKILKEILVISQESNIDLHLFYFSTKDNPADIESRRISMQDVKLADEKWKIGQCMFIPHTVDLMAIDSNVMLDKNFNPLKLYSPFPSKLSAGVNVFSQDVSGEEHAYVFPLFCLIFRLLKFLQESCIGNYTIIVPDLYPRPTGILRIVRTAELCRSCGYANDAEFNFFSFVVLKDQNLLK